jgi:3-hydroxyacyl-[acyl-carrier-protein] dehydratase
LLEGAGTDTLGGSIQRQVSPVSGTRAWPRVQWNGTKVQRAGIAVRFELIDREIERSDERIVAIKTVTLAEEYLADHFPGFAVLPGVLMLETMVQAGRRLVSGDRHWALAQVRNVRYGQMVRPGQSLRVSVEIRKRHTGPHAAVEFQGVGEVDGQVAVQGRFTLKPLV